MPHARLTAAAALLVLTVASNPTCAADPRFPIGAYLGNPNGSDSGAEANFEAAYGSLRAALKTAPQMILGYVDYTQPVSAWVSNTSWQAWSNAQSKDAKNKVPVIGLPMASIAAGSATPDQQFQAFASGQYDATLTGIVQAWAQQGFHKLVIRPGWEMNIEGPTYVGDDAQSQADWVAAFRHIDHVLHAAASAAHVGLRVVWNPNVSNYATVSATRSLYPGDGAVDVIAADNYADIHPYSDGGNPPTYHDWHTGGEDTSIAQFIADPVNRRHYWTWPAATEYSNDSSQGHSQTLNSLIAFAREHGKPFAIGESGAGNCSAATDVCDDPTFADWLADRLHAAASNRVTISFVDIWDSNGGGNYEFSFAADGKPHERVSWGRAFGSR